MEHRNRTWVSGHSLLYFLLLLIPSGIAQAGKIPLQPEELQDQSDLIVVGRIVSHFETEKENRDGSQTTHVYLRVEVLDVEKGTDASQGGMIEIGCWVITRAPRQGSLWDSGHAAIPADEGRARFFLQRHGDHLWDAIYPNGIERLDDSPTLDYPMKPADQAPSLAMAVIGGGFVFLLATVTFVWLFVSRRPTAKSPAS